MNITILKSKIHRGTITGVDASYEGSIVIDPDLMEEVGLRRYEKVLVADLNTAARFETYAIEGKRGSGGIQLNGAAALLGSIGDRVIIFAFATMSESEAEQFSPRIIQLDGKNQIVRKSFA